MDTDTDKAGAGPVRGTGYALTQVLRRGAKDLLKQTMEAEVRAFLDDIAEHTLDDGRRAVVRNGDQPERTVQTGIGEVPVQVPKTRDRSGAGVHFTSNVLPPYQRRSRLVKERLPWLYLKGVSAGDFQEALTALLGEQAEDQSASALVRLKQQWLVEHEAWRERDLSERRYLYWWADGIHFNRRGSDDERACLLVIIGVLPDGTKEFVALDDGVCESTRSWYELLLGLRDTQAGEAQGRTTPCHRRRGAWVLEGPGAELPRHTPSALLGPQDCQRAQPPTQKQPGEGETRQAGNPDGRQP